MATVSDRLPRISLGVVHVKERLEELVAELEEPITITVHGRRAAVLVPFEQYVSLLRALAAAEEAMPSEPDS